ncbi:acyltransferase [Clostridium perfringens]|uniref:acyltransferase n=2 Tax=Clostridium perfringens TaxID=1502 RepID=UPI001A284B9F|nr:acyltransferase [Clostridium perfringens]EHR0217396.1 acyltransferase [Clostridium perfringens]EHR0219739.1 acyltransferase [Clostridium perfringens]EJT6159591.1 acyltransferase [Clostridium perfringens]EJT6160620.1 acyltransferase [Clostridium perfringens]MDN4557324.1 acyltransferase [Clostridium perfringens]
MKKIKKIFLYIERELIKKVIYINHKKYMNLYNKYLKKIGVNIDNGCSYIDSSVYIDGTDYTLISLGDNVVLSREVTILTHDFSNLKALEAIKVNDINRYDHIIECVSIGENSFIGAKSIILPGACIGKNVIVGAGSVVKGKIDDNIVVAGNPAKFIKKVDKYASEFLKYE